MIETYTLDNGMRIVAAPSPTDVVYCGIAVDAGSRDELEGEEGMAHFTEHLTFKGTRRRRAWHILNRMESVGGELNAYTGKEETVYYSSFLKEHFARAIDLLLDVVLGSTYPQTEMDKEVEVVIDEIESYNDSPSELIYDEFENLIFQGHPLGHSILGNADVLRKMRSEDILRFTQRHYRPERMVLYVLGNVPMEKIIKEVKKYSESFMKCSESNVTKEAPLLWRGGGEAVVESIGRELIIPKSTHQAHVIMGTRSFCVNDPRHLSLFLLNNILGGPGMNSRLNLALRERNGLVYTVESSMSSFTDAGVWCVYFGCDPHDITRCRKLVLRELSRLTDAPLSESALRAAKRQLIGQVALSYDAFESVAIGMGKRYLHYGTTQTCAELCAKVEALTAEQLHATARELFVPEHLTTLIYS